MARDLTIDLEVNPTLNAQAARNLINTLEKELRKVQSGTHLPLAQKVSTVYDRLIDSGLAATPTSARIAFSKLAGGKFSERQQGVLRLAEGITAKKTYAEKYYDVLQSQIERFRERPTPEGRADILKTVANIEKTVASINKSQKNLPYALKQVTQNVTGIKKEVSDWNFDEPEKQSNVKSQLLSFVKKLTGITTLAAGAVSLIKKGGQGVINALNRGAQAMRLQAAYGKDIDWRDIRARAGIFNMSTETAGATSQYASDFQQRMLWGEVSEREVIGLSRAGRWGRMVLSGEAKKNPQAANQAFEELVGSTDQAKMRSILRQLGLPQDLMQYNIQGYDTAQRAELTKKFEDVAEKEWQAAVMMYDAGNQIQVALEGVSGVLANVTGTSVATMYPRGKAVAARLGVDKVYEPTAGFNILSASADQIRSSVGWGNNINQTVNNNITIQGNADENTVAALRDEMSRPQAISGWFQQAQIMGGRTKY